MEYRIYKPVGDHQSLRQHIKAKIMIIKIAACLIVGSVFTSCQTTQSTAARPSLESRLMAQNSVGPNSVDEPAPPAEGPEDVPADGTIDPVRNPGLVPTPLLRTNAAGSL